MLKLWVVGLVLLVTATSPAVCQEQPSTIDELSFDGWAFMAIRVREIDSASSWYQTVFGLEEVKRMETEDGVYSIRLLSGDGLSVELIAEQGVEAVDDQHLGFFKVGIYVTDIETFHRRLNGLGVDQDPQIYVDQTLHVRSFVFRDLEGNRIQVFQRCGEACQ